MKYFILTLLLIGVVSCDKKESDLVVIGNIKGLKKGTVYLKRLKDTAFITMDSVSISGNPEFRLESSLPEPEVLYLVLDKNDTDEGRVRFFADKGITEINTTLKNFAFDAKIKGSRHQDLLQQFDEMSLKYSNKNLDLIQENFNALRDKDTIKAMETDQKHKNLIRSKYLYAINFALNNKTSHVSPYVALTEVFDANIKYLDTIYTSLPDSIATSMYGKKLKKLIAERKELKN